MYVPIGMGDSDSYLAARVKSPFQVAEGLIISGSPPKNMKERNELW